MGIATGLGSRMRAVAAGMLICGALAHTSALAGGRIGGAGFGGARIGAPSAGIGYGAMGARPSSSSVIRHGSTGFSIYSQQGITRVIGDPGVSRNVRLPDGRSARVVGDGKGGATVYGPGGAQRIFGNGPLPLRDGP